MDQAEALVMKISRRHQNHSIFVPIREIVSEVSAKKSEKSQSLETVSFSVMTNYRDLDELTNGFQNLI